MYKRVEDLAKTLPKPALDVDPFDDVMDQHIRNAHRLRAEAFKCHAIAAGNVIWALVSPIRRLEAIIVGWFRSGQGAHDHN